MLTAEHLPPAVRKGGVTLVHGLLGRRGTEAAWSPGALPTSGSGLGARPVVICLAERPWDAARARPQQLMTHLARRGWPVLYVCKSPSASLAPAPAGAHEATEVAPRVFLLQLTGGPGRADLPGWPEEDEAAAWCACVEELRLSTDVREAVVVMQRLDWWPVAERLRESSGWPVVYDRTERRWDVDQDSSHLRALEARVMAEVDGIWASSATLLGSTPASSHLVSLVGNACDRELWATPAPEPPGLPPRPRIVCQAQLDGLLDVELLRELAHARPQWSLVLPGAARAAAGAALAALPNVHFLTPPSAADLPALLGAMDLGVLPFASNRLTEGMDPVELHELAASGLPVVATPLPEITSRGDLVETAEGPRALLEAAERALARLPDSEATRRRRRSLAASWHDRAAAAASNLEQVFPLVSIVIVTYNNLQLTRLCLDSILAVTEYPNLELVIVDNASSDGTGAWLAEYARAHESTRVVLNDDNRGFAAGTNQGVREARGEILCLLNNDTVVTAGWLSALVQALRSDHKLGMVGPVTNAAGNEAKVRARYATLAELPAWAAAYTRSHEGASMELPMLALFCAALRREVWERVGELDEQFEIGMFEDDDYCRRIRAAGFELRCLKYAFVHHWQRAAFRLLGDDLYWRTYTANRARFRKKWCHGQRPTAGGRGSAGPSRIQG
jgi:GT2 family glycosyltransferase